MLAKRPLTEVDLDRLGYFAAIHDFGKLNHGFQNKSDPKSKDRAGHLTEAIDLLHSNGPIPDAARTALRCDHMAAWFDSLEHLIAFLQATISHHGRPLPAPGALHLPWWQTATGGRDPIRGLADLSNQASGWFPKAFRQETVDSLPANTEFIHAWCGLLTLADWIGSDNARFFPFGDDPSEDRMPFARAKAKTALEKLSIAPNTARAALGPSRPTFRTLADPTWSPRPAQASIEELDIQSGGSICVLEAETGSGKTEAALLHYLRMLHADQVDSLYFALPTRTAATQIHTRLTTDIKRAFKNGEAPPVTLAVPGYLRYDDQNGLRLPNWQFRWDENEELATYRGWAAEQPKRYLAGAIVAGTIDQVLLSSLVVSHTHLRSTSLLRSLLVVDEVHANDLYMTQILAHVLQHHTRAGGHSLLLSATLGAEARHRLLSSIPGAGKEGAPSVEQAVNTPYPLLSIARTADPVPELIEPGTRFSVTDRGTGQKVVQFVCRPLLEAPQTIANLALDAAAAGAKVLIIRNTVKGCLAVQEALESIAGEQNLEQCLFTCKGLVTTHHSRYSKEDRKLLDWALEDRLGRERDSFSEPHSSGAVVAATQTCEQSLDLDADFMISDLAPMDVLLQRAGRLHRHTRDRPPGSEQARLLVAAPEESLVELINKKGRSFGPGGMGTVYRDLRILELTQRQLALRGEVQIPRDNRCLVESALHSGNISELEASDERWLYHRREIQGEEYAAKGIARADLIRRDLSFLDPDVLFPGKDTYRKVLTRLGADDRLIDFEQPVTTPFGSKLEQLSIPARQLGETDGEITAQNVTEAGGAVHFVAADRPFIYTRTGLQTVVEGQ